VSVLVPKPGSLCALPHPTGIHPSCQLLLALEAMGRERIYPSKETGEGTGVLLARKRSSERMAMALTRRMETAGC